MARLYRNLSPCLRRIGLGLASAAAMMGGAPAAADQFDPRLDALFEALREGQPADAGGYAAKIRRIWAAHPSASTAALYARALASAEASDSALAVELLDHVIGLSPNFAEGFVLRGLARRRIGDEEGAADDLRHAVKLEPRHFLAHRMLAELAIADGDKRAAYGHLQDALAANPHDEAAISEARRLRREFDGQET